LHIMGEEEDEPSKLQNGSFVLRPGIIHSWFLSSLLYIRLFKNCKRSFQKRKGKKSAKGIVGREMQIHKIHTGHLLEGAHKTTQLQTRRTWAEKCYTWPISNDTGPFAQPPDPPVRKVNYSCIWRTTKESPTHVPFIHSFPAEPAVTGGGASSSSGAGHGVVVDPGSHPRDAEGSRDPG
jgi:hypothetical protein